MYSVLLVDDSVALREALARSLTRRGCHVTTAGDGVEALQLVRNQPLDLVITDLNLPDRNGLWLWRHAVVLRPELRGRFILIASEPLPAQHAMALFTETERFLLKPLSLDALWREIQEAMNGGRPAASRLRTEPPESMAGRPR